MFFNQLAEYTLNGLRYRPFSKSICFQSFWELYCLLFCQSCVSLSPQWKQIFSQEALVLSQLRITKKSCAYITNVDLHSLSLSLPWYNHSYKEPLHKPHRQRAQLLFGENGNRTMSLMQCHICFGVHDNTIFVGGWENGRGLEFRGHCLTQNKWS